MEIKQEKKKCWIIHEMKKESIGVEVSFFVCVIKVYRMCISDCGILNRSLRTAYIIDA